MLQAPTHKLKTVVLLSVVIFGLSSHANSPQCLTSLNDSSASRSLSQLNTSDLVDFELHDSLLRVIVKPGEWYIKSTLAASEETANGAINKNAPPYRLTNLLRSVLQTAEFTQLTKDPSARIELDLSAVEKISTEMGGALFMFNKQIAIRFPRPQSNDGATNIGNRLFITGVNPAVLSYLRISGLIKILELTPKPI